ncbi:hypothetical protein F4805DRAFT_475198 [Annulohypoxylon moriforme]|nr:hypothetical protein F4805DRAFT_475198 [Annulohypoxylon moriforme]
MALYISFFRSLSRLILVLVVLMDTVFGLVQTMQCPDNVLDDLQEVMAVSKYSSEVLKTFDSSVPYSNTTGDPRLAAYGPLLNPDDKLTLKGYLDSIANIATSEESRIVFYCSDYFITENVSAADLRKYWWDTEFYDNNTHDAVSLPIQWGDLTPPTERTFTTLGWNAGYDNNALGQAHIFLSPRTLNMSQDPSVDGRALAKIRDDGLKPDKNFNHIDYLRPLSRSIMRELFIVVGGLVNPFLNTTRVINIPGKNTNISMFDDCLAQKNEHPASVTIAECLTIVTIGLYLQIHNTPTFWSTGVVNRETLKAEDPSSDSFQDMKLSLG